MTARTLRTDVSKIPVLVESATVEAADSAEVFVPKPTEPSSAEAFSADTASASDSDSGGPRLSERDRAVLEFEKRQWKHAGAKDQAIRDGFDLSPTRYYQILNTLLDRPEAQQLEPVLVNRLRRQRAAKRRTRSGRP